MPKPPFVFATLFLCYLSLEIYTAYRFFLFFFNLINMICYRRVGSTCGCRRTRRGGSRRARCSVKPSPPDATKAKPLPAAVARAEAGRVGVLLVSQLGRAARIAQAVHVGCESRGGALIQFIYHGIISCVPLSSVRLGIPCCSRIQPCTESTP